MPTKGETEAQTLGRSRHGDRPLVLPQTVSISDVPLSSPYEYAELTVWFSEDGCPAEEPERLLIRRSLDQEAEVKFQRSNAPASVPMKRVAEAGGSRWTVEEGFQCGKGECGLDEYETRGWIGWHHHTALSLLALWFLTQQRLRLGKKEPQMTVPEVRALLQHLLDVRQWNEKEILAWSDWRRKRNRVAKECHKRRRARRLRELCRQNK